MHLPLPLPAVRWPSALLPLLLLPLQLLVGSASGAGMPFAGTVLSGAGDGRLRETYDYVVVGGGVSGLVVANRLTEREDVTVLVIEAGGIDSLEPTHLYPRLVMQAGTAHNRWPLTSAANPALNNRTSGVSSAKTLGGGSAINGMLFDRGSRGDYDLWGELVGDEEGWGWEGLLPYFKKSETFTPPTKELQEEMGVTYDMDAHGDSGPVYSSYPPFIYETAKFLRTAAQQLGLPTPKDGGSGEAIGVIWTPNSLHPTLAERSYARNTYHVVSSARPNYHVLVNSTVTRLLQLEPPTDGGDDTPDLRWVEYTSSAETNYTAAERHVVMATREVILAAGAAHTPRLLQLSGIGPRRLLERLGIPVLVDLGGVGENLQDHPTSSLGWTSTYKPSSPRQDPASANNINSEIGASLREEYLVNRTGPWTVSTGSILGFFTAGHIGLDPAHLTTAATEPPELFLPRDVDATVIEGYQAQKTALLTAITEGTVSVLEMTFTPTNSLNGLMKPLSRGCVQITSRDPYQPPHLDFRAFSHPFDISVAIANIRFQQTVFAQAPLLTDVLHCLPVSPPPEATDAELTAILRRSLSPTFAHLAGTCAMMPREKGGVVDAELKVYGAGGRVRVVDASMIPVIPGTHLQAGVYAVAEKAADLIKRDW